jgi:hypothetical protein
MKCPFQRPSRPFFLFCVSSACLLASITTMPARATDFTTLGDPGHWRVLVSPYTRHWRYSDEHRSVYALGVERQRDDRWLGGAAYFRNSFGQPSAYVYVGKRFEAVWGVPELYGQVTGGVIYGYVGKYKKKLALNFNGFAPAVLPSMGWQFNKEASVSLHLLGDAGVMIQLAWDFR